MFAFRFGATLFSRSRSAPLAVGLSSFGSRTVVCSVARAPFSTRHAPSESEKAAGKEPRITVPGFSEFEMYPSAFQEITPSAESRKATPLVVIAGWLLCKPRHLAHYVELYRQMKDEGQNFDFVVIRPQVKDVLLPSNCKKLARRLLELLSTEEMRDRPILLHGFSVGGYFFGNVLEEIAKNEAEYMKIAECVRGQIYDSIVDLDGVPNGLGLSIFPTKPILQKLVAALAHLYLALSYPITLKYYKKSSEQFHQNFIRSPSLWFYCKTDPLASHESIDIVMAKWRAKGNEVEGICFESSEHVKHLQNFSDDYRRGVHTFVRKIFPRI